MSIKGRIERLEKVVQTHDPKAAARQAEAAAWVEAEIRKPWKPTGKKVSLEDIYELLGREPGAVSRPSPVYFKS